MTKGSELSEAERRVVTRLRFGESNKQIGRALGLQEGTIKNHMKNALRKLGLTNRVQIALWAEREAMRQTWGFELYVGDQADAAE